MKLKIQKTYQKAKELPSYLTKVTINNNYNKSVQVTVSFLSSPDIVPTPQNISSETDTLKPKESVEITKGAIKSVTIISSDKKEYYQRLI